MKGYPTPLASFAEGARACLRRFETSGNQLHEGVSMKLTRQTRKLTKICIHEDAAPLHGPVRVGRGTPHLSLPSPEGARACLRRSGVRKNQLNKTSACHKRARGDANYQITRAWERGTVFWPRARGRVTAEGARAGVRWLVVSKTCHEQGISMSLTFSSRRRLTDSWRGGEGVRGTHPCRFLRPRERAHASCGLGSEKK